MLNYHNIKVSYMIYDESQTSWIFTRSIEELNTVHLLRAAPERSQSRISKAGGSDQYIKSSVRLYLAMSQSAVIKYITFQFFFLL